MSVIRYVCGQADALHDAFQLL